MKPNLPLLPTLSSLIVFAAGVTLPASGQIDARHRPVSPTARADVAGRANPAVNAGAVDLSRGVYLASIDVEDRSLRRYAGQNLLNTEGAELGAVRDFIVHPATSRVRYVVVSTGGVLRGMGNSLRLVPFEALRRGTRGNTFEVDILQSAWLQVPPVSDEHYVIDRFEISPAQHEQMVRRFHAGDSPARNIPAASQSAETGLVRATTLRGKAVHVANRKVGDIENIIIDLEAGTAAALLDSSGDFTGTTAKYLIPLSGLAFSNARQDPIGMTLARADFDRAVPANLGRPETGAASIAVERPLTPTGRTDTPVGAVPASDTLAASARAVRHAIDNDPALVGERIHVITDNGNVILTGTVRSEMARQNLETVARRALPAGRIENRVTVVNR
jgi:hypothetical protein